MVDVVLEALDGIGVNYVHKPEDCLIEMDLGGQDRLYEVMKLLTENLEKWCYDLLLELKINIDYAFERITIKY